MPIRTTSRARRGPPLADYIEAQPAIHMVRVMERFFAEIVDTPPFRDHLPELHVAYMEILNEELSSYALTLALAIAELEDAFPDIEAPSTGREER
jgi:hypothetical protein